MTMKQLVANAVSLIKKNERVKSFGEEGREAVADMVDGMEISGCAETTYYLAGYLRGVAEERDVTLRELLENP